MIPKETEQRIAYYFFHNYLPASIKTALETLLLAYYLDEDEPVEDEMVEKAIRLIDEAYYS